MKKLIEMIEQGCSADEIAARATMLSQQGLLQDYIETQGDISELPLLSRENAEMIVGKWERVGTNLWIRREDADIYSAIILYPEMNGFYMLYRFETNLSEYDESVIAEYCIACPPPENVLNRRAKELYSLFMSLPLSQAVDRCATKDAEIKTLWLRKYEITGG